MINGGERRASTGLAAIVAKRVEVSQPAILYSGNGAAPIHLLDLSLTGAMALADTPPVEGTLISIACASEYVPARVVWTRGDRFGLAFTKPLMPVQAEAMAGIAPVQVPAPTPFSVARRVRCGTASLAPGVIKREGGASNF